VGSQAVAVAEVAPLLGTPGIVDAFPNPFSNETMIRFAVAAEGDVVVDVFDVQGRRVRRVLEGPVAAGAQQVAWDGRDDAGRRVSPGVYFGRVRGADVKGVVRLTVMR
jgi:flagellar hook assembly protein FlgD